MSASLRIIVIVVAILLWAGAVVAVFAQNRLILAFWFVLTHLMGPLTFFLLGWLCHTIFSRGASRPVLKTIVLHLAMLVLAFVALPIILSAVNLLPVGQTTDSWSGTVSAHEQIVGTGITGSTVTVTSDLLGPQLRFLISDEEYRLVDAAIESGDPGVVEGVVVRGFMGVPIAVRLKPILEDSTN